jgi:hypothetical protein
VVGGGGRGVVDDQVDGGAEQIVAFFDPGLLVGAVGGRGVSLAEHVDVQGLAGVAAFQAGYLAFECGDMEAVGAAATDLGGEFGTCRGEGLRGSQLDVTLRDRTLSQGGAHNPVCSVERWGTPRDRPPITERCAWLTTPGWR